jgi:hypothetical protein
MTEASASKDPNQMRSYMEALINPFSLAIKSPKILDGEIKYTAALKLRATGEIICSPTLNTNIFIFPGLTNVICYSVTQSGPDARTPDDINVDGTIFKQHVSTAADRSNVRLARLTGAAARFFLTNSAEEDDGYWEAARITSHVPADTIIQNDSTDTYTGLAVLKVLETDYELANNPTYQFGHLRDLHKFVFKLNSTDNDHKFSPVAGLDAPLAANVESLADFNQWDMIFIKIRGRRNVVSPSVLRFDTVSNQELVYAENSPLARMMEETYRDNNIDNYLEFSRVELPGFQAIN